MGSAIGNLAKFFVGSRGLKKQGKARNIEMGEQAEMEAEQQARQSQALAETLAGWGINPDLPQDSPVFGEAMRRSRPPAPTPAAKPEKAKLADGKTYWITGDKAGQQVVEGIEPPEPAGKMAELADGYTYWTTGPDKGKRVNPNVEAAAPGPQTVVNVTNQPELQKSTVGQLEKKLIQSQESLGRMDQIITDFKPEYLTIGDKIETSLLGWQEKAGMTLDPSQKKALADRATFFQKTFDSVNRAIRDMTGAQMSEGEADRLMRGMPNQDDAPTEFMAKMQSVIGQIKSYDRLYRETMGQGIGPTGEAAPNSDPLGLF